MTLSAGKLIADPIDAPLGAVAVNIHPKRFDPGLDRPSPAERWRLFAGAAFAPEFGLIAGAGYGVVRGLSVNVGVGALWIDELRDVDEFGAEPTDAADPYDDGVSSIAFLTLGYSF